MYSDIVSSRGRSTTTLFQYIPIAYTFFNLTN